MGPDAPRTTSGSSLPDSPFEDLDSGRRRRPSPSRVSPRVEQTIRVKAFPFSFPFLQGRSVGLFRDYVQAHSFTIGENAIFDIIMAMRVNVLVLENVFDLGLSAVLDAFQTANELIQMSGLTVPPFEVKIAGVRKAVKTSQGLAVPLSATGWRSPDCVVVPAIGFKMPGPLESALARPDIQDGGASLRQWARGGAMMT